jgi:ABC-type antimicrobial peptide transport system permease subunit
LYGLTAYQVARRTPEIGVRMALGARPVQVLRHVIRGALALVAIGVALGLAAAAGLARLVETLLFGVSGTDPVTFVAAAVILIAVGLLAAYLPARRAARVDPTTSLKWT